jgi:hypothetical protein
VSEAGTAVGCPFAYTTALTATAFVARIVKAIGYFSPCTNTIGVLVTTVPKDVWMDVGCAGLYRRPLSRLLSPDFCAPATALTQ